ncbi:MAG: hypothetical protein H2069_07890 [Legionella sp.]|nr:hypothetical protein [Legionella sp.]
MNYLYVAESQVASFKRNPNIDCDGLMAYNVCDCIIICIEEALELEIPLKNHDEKTITMVHLFRTDCVDNIIKIISEKFSGKRVNINIIGGNFSNLYFPWNVNKRELINFAGMNHEEIKEYFHKNYSDNTEMKKFEMKLDRAYAEQIYYYYKDRLPKTDQMDIFKYFSSLKKLEKKWGVYAYNENGKKMKVETLKDNRGFQNILKALYAILKVEDLKINSFLYHPTRNQSNVIYDFKKGILLNPEEDTYSILNPKEELFGEFIKVQSTKNQWNQFLSLNKLYKAFEDKKFIEPQKNSMPTLKKEFFNVGDPKVRMGIKTKAKEKEDFEAAKREWDSLMKENENCSIF